MSQAVTIMVFMVKVDDCEGFAEGDLSYSYCRVLVVVCLKTRTTAIRSRKSIIKMR